MTDFHQIWVMDEQGNKVKIATIHAPSFEMAEIVALCLDNIKQNNAKVYIRSLKNKIRQQPFKKLLE